MTQPRHITIIGQERPFDAAKWQELLIAFAYVLHDRRKVGEQPPAEPSTPTGEVAP